jgi:hypothetical protein
MSKGKTKSSRTTSSDPKSKKSPLNEAETVEAEVGGHKLELIRFVIGKRGETRIMSNDDLAKVPAEAIINVEAVTPPPFQKPEPPVPPPLSEGVEPTTEYTTAVEARVKWEADKAEWETLHPVDDNLKQVSVWMGVYQIAKAMLDGQEMKVFHTVRGPILGLVTSEDLHRAYLHSPCFIDPNIERGRVHYLPIAFAGFEFILYKMNCIGESVPQLSELMGYPAFIDANRRGFYQFRMRAAYHHIEADLPEDAPVLSVSTDVRAHQEGLVPTSDSREEQVIDKTRAINAARATPQS